VIWAVNKKKEEWNMYSQMRTTPYTVILYRYLDTVRFQNNFHTIPFLFKPVLYVSLANIFNCW
jgi:hypothetical protein